VAKKKRKNTKKQLNKQNKEVIYYIIAFLVLLILLIGLFNIGIGGTFIKNIFNYLCGDIVDIIVMIQLFIYFGYVLVKGDFLKLFSRYVIGSLIFDIGLLIIMAYINSNNMSGLKIIDYSHLALSKLGIIQMLLFGGLSEIFNRSGALMFGVFFIIIGIIIYFMISVSTYLQRSSNSIKNITEDTKNNLKTFIENKNNNKKQKSVFFKNVKNDNLDNNVVPINMMEESELISNNESNIGLQDINDSLPFDLDEDEELLINNDKIFDLDNIIMEHKDYVIPSIDLLNNPKKSNGSNDNLRYAQEKADLLTKFLSDFNINAKVANINIGPSITKFEVVLATGTRVNRVANLFDDIKMALAVKQLRIEAPIPGKSAIGIEIPNIKNTIVTLKEVLQDIDYSKENKLVFGLGKDINGKSIYTSLNKMPHLLVAGTTGSGKSVCINSIIISFLLNASFEDVKMLLIDPKKVELSVYNNIPHLLTGVVNDPKQASVALKRVVDEMEERFQLLAEHNCKNMESYNQYVNKFNNKISDDKLKIKPLPYIVVIIDELADLMMVAPKEVEESIMRIAQMGRAAGINLIVATQRPSTDVITGLIKANIPSRIAFAVGSGIDSRTILDMVGAEKLLGKGDMLFKPIDANAPLRIQGTFLSDKEVEKVVYAIKKQSFSNEENIETNKFNDLTSKQASTVESSDDLYDEVVAFIKTQDTTSTSSIQRRFRIGYNRAANLIDDLQANSYISGPNGSKPRDVLKRGELDE
jgi:S-DNA-T family DNA segregation ATPase FtsK/SpoIIIE